MKCVVCHSDHILTKTVDEDIRQGADIIRVPIETLVCQDCGERYYDRQTMRRLERIRQNIDQRKAQLTQVGKVLVCRE